MSEGKIELNDLDARAKKTMAELQLLPGENILRVWEGDGFFLGSHPIAKAIAKLQQIMTTLMCGHVRVYIVVTNMRIIVANSSSVYCGATASRSIKTLALASLLEASVSRDTQCCCCHTRTVQFQTRTEDFGVVVKKFRDEDLRDFLDFLGRVMVNNASSPA